jgi:bifunctional non-homologous end joining protein LigD
MTSRAHTIRSGGNERDSSGFDQQAGLPVCHGRRMGTGSLPLIRPMLATLGELPAPPGWSYEFKWDGVRVIAYLDRGRMWAASRNDRDVTDSYPELRALLDRFPRRQVILDGEIVALDARGRPSFSLLQQRMHVRTPTAALLERVPIQLYVFDLLHLGPRTTLELPYTRRRQLLAELDLDDPVVKTPPSWPNAAGADLLGAAADLGLEGVVAKRLDAPYQPGTRSRLWIKTPLNPTVEVIIAGWKPGAGHRAGLIGSLLLGMYDRQGRLTFVGHVGTGFTHEMLTELGRQLQPLARATSPFDVPVPREHTRDAHWVHPQLVGEVAYRTRTPDNRLRHPTWRGLRPDRQPAEVTVDLLH